MSYSLLKVRGRAKRGGLGRTDRRMRVLFITIDSPYPPVAGPELRNWQNIAAASEGFETAVAFLTPENAAPPPPEAAPGLKVWRRLGQASAREVWAAGGATPLDLGIGPATLADLETLLQDFAPRVVVLCHTHLYSLLPRAKARGAAVVVDMHNVESHLYRHLVPPRLPLKWLQRRFFDPGARRIRAVERSLMDHADQIWLCSDIDRRRLTALGFSPLGYGTADLAVVPNGVPPGRYRAEAPRSQSPSRAAGRPPRLLFLGQLGYPPNVQAARYIARVLAPRLARRWPELRILVAGRSPSRKLAALLTAAGNIEVLADPPDVAPLLQAADLLLAPLFKGGGTRLKVMEAWAAGLPIVATPMTLEGVACRDGEDVLLARTAQGLVQAVGRLLEDQALYARLSAGGLARIRRQYGQERIAPLVRDLLTRAAT